jgi:hypothetical protein
MLLKYRKPLKSTSKTKSDKTLYRLEKDSIPCTINQVVQDLDSALEIFKVRAFKGAIETIKKHYSIYKVILEL